MSLGTNREYWLIRAALDAKHEDVNAAGEQGVTIFIEDLLLNCPIRPPSYRRGMQRLVGRALCSECLKQQPALTCFDVDPKDMSGGWQVCDDCLRKALPPTDVEQQLVEARAKIERLQCCCAAPDERRLFSPFCTVHGPGQPGDPLRAR